MDSKVTRALLVVVFSLVAIILATPFIAMAQAATHSATLAWTDSTNPATTTYNVYRSGGACPANSPNKLTNVTAKTYTDTAVMAGATYCYFVRAMYSGSESGDSNHAQALIPVDAVPPTSLTVTIK